MISIESIIISAGIIEAGYAIPAYASSYEADSPVDSDQVRELLL